MKISEELDNKAQEQEDEAFRLEAEAVEQDKQQQRISAEANLQRAQTLRTNAKHMRQEAYARRSQISGQEKLLLASRWASDVSPLAPAHYTMLSCAACPAHLHCASKWT